MTIKVWHAKMQVELQYQTAEGQAKAICPLMNQNNSVLYTRLSLGQQSNAKKYVAMIVLNISYLQVVRLTSTAPDQTSALLFNILMSSTMTVRNIASRIPKERHQ